MFNRTDQDIRLVGQQLLPRGPGVLDRRLDVGHVESHITNNTFQLRMPEVVGSMGHTTVGYLGKAHKIHAMVNNR
jgi:glutamate/tyrosine decarboxylase-like PLP-dependent enzyme